MSEPQSLPPIDPGAVMPPPRSDEPAGQRRDFAAPLGTATGGRLEIVPGASRVTIAAGALALDLVRARFEGEVPNVSAGDGAVTIRYPRHSLLDWVKDALNWNDRAATIALNGTIPWRIEVDGGASELTADLAELRLDALGIGGGVSRVELGLPRPSGVVLVRIGGGASNLAIHRPLGVAARLRVRGGASRLVFDDQRAGAVGGEVRWQSPDFASATDRYEIEVGGGASNLTVDTR